MSVKVAINGFGRIGRLAFRQMFAAEGYEVVAINELTSPKMLAHLLKYDTAQGRYDHDVCADDEAHTITVDGKTLKIYAEKDAVNCPWGELGVDVVLECTGFYCSKEKSMAHINAGAKKVVISAPAGNDLKTIVFSVNENTLTKEDTIISAAHHQGRFHDPRCRENLMGQHRRDGVAPYRNGAFRLGKVAVNPAGAVVFAVGEGNFRACRGCPGFPIGQHSQKNGAGIGVKLHGVHPGRYPPVHQIHSDWMMNCHCCFLSSPSQGCSAV